MTARPLVRHRGTAGRRLRPVALAIAVVVALLLVGCTPPQAKSGELDATYSGDGVVQAVNGPGAIQATVQQADGRTVAAGTGYHPDASPALSAVYVARYDTAGNAEPGFGSNGFAKVDVVSGAEVVRAVTLDSAGRILVTGYIPAADYPDDSDAFVIRLTSAGQPDTTFSGDGIAIIDRSNHDRAAAIVTTGSRILVAASFDSGGNWANEWTVLALDNAGATDTTFNGDGVATVPTAKVGSFDGLRSMALQTDGKIVLGGTNGSEFASARLLATGNLDLTWHGDGVARTTVGNGGEAHTVLVQPDGKVVLTGLARPAGTRSDEDMAAVRWTSTGALDPSFDGDGQVFVDFGRQTNDRAYSAALAPDSKLVLAGFANTAQGMDLAVARLNHEGSLDTSFSDDGRITTNWGATGNEQLEAVTIGPAGRVIGGGWFHDGWLMVGYKGGSNVNLSVSDVSVTEPNTGTTDAVFTVSLSNSWTTPITVRYDTANGTAVAPGDYAGRTGTLTFAPGETSKTVRVPVQGDTVPEANEQFRLDLSLPTNAGIADGTGVATIVNND